MFEPSMIQLMLQLTGGHHGGLRGIMEFFQVRHDGATQPSNAIVLTVGMEIGSEISTHWQLQFLGYL